MKENSGANTPICDSVYEARDLRNTLLFGGLSVFSFGLMILAAASGLQIPPMENLLVVSMGLLVTIGGLVALRLGYAVRRVTWVALLAYAALVISPAVHYTGGPLTPMPALYLLVVVAASFNLGRRGATIIATVSVICYAIVLLLEYTEVLDMVLIWELTFDPRERGPLLIVNWLAVTIPTMITAQLAGALAERLKHTNQQLRESERLRENLTQMVVHDLRNPLSALLGWVDLALNLGAKDDKNPQHRLLTSAHRSGQVLMGLVNELLDISKLEAGKLKLNLNAVQVDAMLQESVIAQQSLIDLEELTAHIKVEDESLTAICDRQLVSRVLTNLLSNAIKYTPPHGRVTLAARRRTTDSIEISIADTGSGIPPEFQEHIFEKFGQVEQFGGERRGTGLGLTFCKMAVEAHNGQIWVESQEGQGSTFLFTLPASPK